MVEDLLPAERFSEFAVCQERMEEAEALMLCLLPSLRLALAAEVLEDLLERLLLGRHPMVRPEAPVESSLPPSRKHLTLSQR